jgi:hypothetical protein
MNGRRAKILRGQARGMTKGAPDREQEVFELPPRSRWVDVPDDGKTMLEKLRNKFLRAMGLPTPTKRVRMQVTPTVIREKRGTTRWVYHRLKRIYYKLLSA